MTVNENHTPKVSVVMSFNNEPMQWLQPAVESILAQTFTDFELIVVCDNPLFSEGMEYIQGIERKDNRIRFVINSANLGPTRSFNIAISVAKGEYIARMDADDISMPERFARQVEYLDSHPETSMCATDAHAIDEKGRIIRKRRYRHKRNQALIAITNPIAHPSVMFRRSLLEVRNPIYNEEYIYSQDYELWQFLTLKGHPFHTLDIPLLLHRKSRSQVSCSKRKKQNALFKKAHKSFITTWLKERKIIDESDTENLEAMLGKASEAYRNISEADKKYLCMIIYVLYFSLGTYSWAYRFRYLFDRNKIVLKIRFIYTFRLFVSRKTRRDRTGFN